VVREHASDLRGLRAKLVFLVAVGARDPERVSQKAESEDRMDSAVLMACCASLAQSQRPPAL